MNEKINKLYEEILVDMPYLYMVSPAYIQRVYGVDYDLASEVVDRLYENGLIDSANGAKPRLVIKK